MRRAGQADEWTQMALQMRDAKTFDIADLGCLDGVQLVAAVEDLLHLIEACPVTAMDRHALVQLLRLASK